MKRWNVYRGTRLSPDGNLVLMGGIGANISGMWAFEMNSHVLRRLLPSAAGSFIWSRDGSQLLFQTGVNQKLNRLSMQAADLSGMARTLHDFGESREWRISDISPDGALIGLTVEGDLLTLGLEEGAALTPFLATPADEAGLRFSPDGRYVTYTSDATGRYEVYVAKFPGPGGKW
ncbi:MAG: TolB family protein [Acidobacteriota bacterium]